MSAMIPFIVLGLGLGLIGWLGLRNERAAWNNGVCPVCGAFWVQFATDSQGGRGYKCQGCRGMETHRIWVSYRSVDCP